MVQIQVKRIIWIYFNKYLLETDNLKCDDDSNKHERKPQNRQKTSYGFIHTLVNERRKSSFIKMFGNV